MWEVKIASLSVNREQKKRQAIKSGHNFHMVMQLRTHTGT